ncbi:hypothetical protein Rumeso_00632 [Rubellimicrobium mesophilum DSM 19309]|uniref:Uncharacterized protein n=1 Tax=Rubellimicrobium mesophilum DSM 19309 TaxID=442562 RepID=A0A017HU89_9RHOB|nr:hypothetical protein Rumeso_00632 [Rubellimicrobium mesophilum DSM 19309]
MIRPRPCGVRRGRIMGPTLGNGLGRPLQFKTSARMRTRELQ